MRDKRIVIATIGSLGDVHPAMALAVGLQARGHQVTLATMEVYRNKIEQAGINFHPLRPNLPDDQELNQRMMHPVKGPEVVFREVILPASRETYIDLMDAVAGSDLLIAGELIFPASLVSEKTGIPWICYILQPASFFSIYDPPVLTAAPYLAQFRFLGPWAVKLFKQLAKFISRSWNEPIWQLRKDNGLSYDPYPIFEGKFSPVLVLALFSSVLGDRQPDWPPQTQITGFTFYDRLSPGSGLAPELEDFLATGEAPIVFTLGSAAVKTAGNFYTESLEAAKQLGYRAVFLVGDSKLKNLPNGMIAVDYAPYSELFPRASAVVHQGGVGTTAQALRAGVPMLVVPYSHDQPDNAARIMRLGVGRTINRRKYQRNHVMNELRILLSNSKYKAKAAEIRQILKTEDGVRTACDAIELSLINVGCLSR